MSKYKLKLGADPEAFVKEDEDFISAHNLIQGTKEKPFPVPYGAVQVDGMAVEFNIKPAMSKEGFVRNILGVQKHLNRLIGKKRKLSSKAVARFSEKVWRETPEASKVLGCEPDYNAYTGKENVAPNEKVDFRTAAGHIHIGWMEGADPSCKDHFHECCALVKELDKVLGLPAMFVDKDRDRQKLYGRMGAFRPKSYGLEYRVLSNFWIKDEKLIAWVHRTIEATLKRLSEGGRPLQIDPKARYSVFDECIEATRSLLIRENVEIPDDL